MRIAIITETFLPSIDGIVTRLCQSIRWIKENGHEVLIIAPDLGVTDFEGTPVAGVSASTFFQYRDKKFSFPYRKVKRYLQDFKPDLVHVVNPSLLGVSGMYYTKQLRLPLVASYHTHVPKFADYYHLPLFKPVLWWYFKTLHNRPDLILCTSRTAQMELKKKKFNNIYLWERGVDTKLYNPYHFDASMRDRLTGGQKDKKLLLFVGRLASEKDIEKIRDVLEQSDNFCLAIVGDGPHRAFLEQYFKETDTVFTGFLYGDELARAYASSDIFVFPSTTETEGLVLLEAMASGLPVVAAKSGSTCGQVNDGITGLLYNPTDQYEFVQMIFKLRDDQFRLKLSNQAHTVIQMAEWEAPSKQLLDVYKETLNEHLRPAKVLKEKSVVKNGK